MKILVIDDCSEDNTLNICLEYKQKFPEKIEIAALNPNQLSQGHFVGLEYYKQVKTKYLAWCDGDDYWIDPKKISKQVAILETNKEIGIVHSDYLQLNENSNIQKIVERRESEIQKSLRFVSGKYLVNGNHVKHSTAMILREAIDLEFVGASRGINAGDWLVCVSAATKLNIYFMREKTAVVRINERGIWNGSNVAYNAEQKSRVRWYCAAQLPESRLREAFRRKVVLDWIRSKIATSQLYQPLRPLVLFARKSKAFLR